MIALRRRIHQEALRARQLAGIASIFVQSHVLLVGGTLFRGGARFDHRVARLAGQRVLRRFGYEVEVSGVEHLEGLTRCGVLANHASYLDWALLLGYFPQPLRFVAKRELAHLPAVGRFLRHRGIFIDRGKGDRAKSAIRDAANDDNPWPIMLFPEGTRSCDGTLRPFKPGGVRILAEAGLTLVPVCLLGTYQAWPRHARTMESGTKLKMIIAEPVVPSACDSLDEAVAEVERRMRAIVEP